MNCGFAITPNAAVSASAQASPWYAQGAAFQTPSLPTTADQSATDPVRLQQTPASASGPYVSRRLIFPRWVGVAILIIGICSIVGAFLVGVDIRHKRWDDAASIAAIAAFGTALLGLLVAIAQVATRQWKRASFVFNLVIVVLLALVGTGGIAFKMPIWMLQAHHYEAVGDWSASLSQYAFMAKDPACSQDCQRTVADDQAHAHYGYGLQLLAQQNYQGAISQFQSVLSASPTGSDVEQAREGMAQAHYDYGVQLSTQQDYQGAAGEFVAAQAISPTGPYAGQAYLAAATAYYSLAQQEISGSTCSDGVTTLQTLVQDYPDSPEATQAEADLAAPVQVSGHLGGYPNWLAGQVWLSKKAHAPRYNVTAQPGTYSFSGDYKTSINPKTGAYTFSQVLPGTYELNMYRYSTLYYHNAKYTWWYAADNIHLNFLQVGPVCPFIWPTYQCKNLCA